MSSRNLLKYFKLGGAKEKPEKAKAVTKKPKKKLAPAETVAFK